MRGVRFPIRILAVLLAATLLLAIPIGHIAAQTSAASVIYVYDDLNRLIAVIDQQGNAATYTYDAVGNILRIERFNAAEFPGQVGITLVSPNEGKVGTTVQIFGKGFSVN